MPDLQEMLETAFVDMREARHREDIERGRALPGSGMSEDEKRGYRKGVHDMIKFMEALTESGMPAPAIQACVAALHDQTCDESQQNEAAPTGPVH